MPEQTPFCSETWINRIRVQELPVLRYTRQQLDEARERMDGVTARDIVEIVLQDPLLAVRMIAQTQIIRGQSLHHDISTIGSSIMMMGIEPFFRTVTDLKSVEEILQDRPQALLGVLKVIGRAKNAARYAHEWALWRVDYDIREITLAALLRDLAEILLYILEPLRALEIHAMLKANPGLRSVEAQKAVLGCSLADIQVALCRAWELPALLLQLIDDREAGHPRVRNVTLAVTLARHLANGWDDPALPSDLAEVAAFLNIDLETLARRLNLALPP
ncbi:MAG: HDOD domain-containing protein [Betaproteobacteria bacterium]|nr:HDOD domain-containing protein [Betaproteobacteria bacterium]